MANLKVGTLLGGNLIWTHGDLPVSYNNNRIFIASADGVKYQLYSEFNKPTPSDVGAVNKTGDTMSGPLTITSSSGLNLMTITPRIEFTETDASNYKYYLYANNGTFSLYKNSVADSDIVWRWTGSSSRLELSNPISKTEQLTDSNALTRVDWVQGQLALKSNLSGATFTGQVKHNYTSSTKIPTGTTAQRGTGESGSLRFNSETSSFEGYNGAEWGEIGSNAVKYETKTASFTAVRNKGYMIDTTVSGIVVTLPQGTQVNDTIVIGDGSKNASVNNFYIAGFNGDRIIMNRSNCFLTFSWTGTKWVITDGVGEVGALDEGNYLSRVKGGTVLESTVFNKDITFTAGGRIRYSGFTSGNTQILNANASHNVYLGNPTLSGIYLEASSSGTFKVSKAGTAYDIYHTGNKPTASDIGLGSLNNWPAVSDPTDTSTTKYATANAVSQVNAKIENIEEIPYPDVWIPFNDSLRMHAGYGDEIKVGDYVVANQASFTRASTATYIDKSGVLRTAAVNEPRFEKEGLLIEGQSTNLNEDSVGGTRLGHGGTAQGTLSNTTVVLAGLSHTFKTLDTTDATSGSSNAGLWSVPTLLDNTVYTLSMRVKIENMPSSGFSVYIYSPVVDADHRVYFTSDYSVTSIGTAISSAKVSQVENGYYRISVSTTGTITPNRLCISVPKGTNITFGCGQIEALPFASSYIPTSGAAATRAADLCDIPSINNIQPFTNDQNTTYAITFDTSHTNGQVITGNNTPAVMSSSRSYTLLRNDPAGMRFFRDSSGVGIGMITPNTQYTAFIRLQNNALNAGKNGVISAEVRNPSVPVGGYGSVTAPFRLGRSADTSGQLWGHIRNFRIWHRALSDAQLKSLR